MLSNLKAKIYNKIRKYRTLAKIYSEIKYLTLSEKKRLEIGKFIDEYIKDIKIEKGKDRNRLIKDVLFSRYYYQINAEEYFKYRFWKMSDMGRKEYVGDEEFSSRFKKIANPAIKEMLDNKYKCYEKFKAYYKREVIEVLTPADFEDYKKLFLRNKRIVIKPIRAYGGRGVKVIETDEQASLVDVFNELLESQGGIVEEPIIQSEKMGCFHPESVNTVRATTYTKNKATKIMLISIRMGTGNSVVDNGCLSAGVDIDTGLITSRGRLAHRNGLYLYHPDTHVQILGNKVPEFDKLKEFVLELAKIIPEQRIVGWDLALTDEGWILVEANASPAIQLLAGDGVGVRKEFEQMV